MTEQQSETLKQASKKIKALIKRKGKSPDVFDEIEKIFQQLEVPVRSADGSHYRLIKPFSHLQLHEIMQLTDDDIDFLLSDFEIED